MTLPKFLRPGVGPYLVHFGPKCAVTLHGLAIPARQVFGQVDLRNGTLAHDRAAFTGREPGVYVAVLLWETPPAAEDELVLVESAVLLPAWLEANAPANATAGRNRKERRGNVTPSITPTGWFERSYGGVK